VRVAVHQPNYAPWCGYFAKMFAADAFVFLDDAQLPQGRSFVSRVKIAKGHDADQWLTVPVRKGAKAIREVDFADEPWAEKHRRTLHHVYAKAAHFGAALDLVDPLYEDPGTSLAELNMRLIAAVAEYLGYEGEFHRSSDHPAGLAADERIAQLVSAVGGDVYVSGAGGQKYQSEAVYAQRGVRLEVRVYEPVPYERSGWDWVGGLSVLDALFHLGRGARDTLQYAGS
jgi:WbqC-like protein family